MKLTRIVLLTIIFYHYSSFGQTRKLARITDRNFNQINFLNQLKFIENAPSQFQTLIKRTQVTDNLIVLDSLVEQIVALKVYRNAKDWNDCKDELKSLMRISGHPNIMEVIDFFEVPIPCVVMPFVNGGDLRYYLDREGAMSKSNALRVLRGIATGLQHLHSNHIVHRDMKSPNILLKMPSFVPVLIDLGLGKALTKEDTQLTDAPKGTILWMAPEMLREKKWSVKTDIFAYGIILWEIVTGFIPYEDSGFESMPEILTFVLISDGRPTLSKASNIPWVRSYGGLLNLMQNCWSKDPLIRPTADEILNALTKE